MSPPPNYEFQEWWNKEREKNSAMADKPDKPSWSTTVEIRSPKDDRTVEKERSRNARQLSWLWLLKFQQAGHCLAWLTTGFFSLLRASHRRISSSSPDRWSDSRLYRLIKAFSVVAVLLLLFELAAYFKGWHFSPPSLASISSGGVVEFLYANWLFVRANYLAPPLQALANLCIVLFLIQTLDRILLVFGCFWIKFRRLKPVPMFEFGAGDVESGNPLDYPMVLLQIPMCNEREVR